MIAIEMTDETETVVTAIMEAADVQGPHIDRGETMRSTPTRLAATTGSASVRTGMLDENGGMTVVAGIGTEQGVEVTRTDHHEEIVIYSKIGEEVEEGTAVTVEGQGKGRRARRRHPRRRNPLQT